MYKEDNFLRDENDLIFSVDGITEYVNNANKEIRYSLPCSFPISCKCSYYKINNSNKRTFNTVYNIV